MFSNEIKSYYNEDYGLIRVTVGKDRDPKFYALDIAYSLGYSRPKDAIKKYVSPENLDILYCDAETTFNPTGKGIPVVNYNGVLQLIRKCKSCTPEYAETFEDWFYDDVLAEISMILYERNGNLKKERYVTSKGVDEVCYLAERWGYRKVANNCSMMESSLTESEEQLCQNQF